MSGCVAMRTTRGLEPRERLVAAPVSHSWVEVSHCFYYNYGEHVHMRTSMWFFAVPGSGVSLNVGRTLHIEGSRFGEHAVERMHKFMILVSRDTARGISRLRQRLRELTNESDVAYDSLQFPLHAPRSGRWRGEQLTERGAHHVELAARARGRGGRRGRRGW